MWNPHLVIPETLVHYFLTPAAILKPSPQTLKVELILKEQQCIAKWGKVQVQLFQLTVDHHGEIRPACDFCTIAPCVSLIIWFLSHKEQIKCIVGNISVVAPGLVQSVCMLRDTPTILV